MFLAAINFHFADHLAAQLRLGQHSQHCLLNHQFRLASHPLAEFFGAQATRVSGVVLIKLVLAFTPVVFTFSALMITT